MPFQIAIVTQEYMVCINLSNPCMQTLKGTGNLVKSAYMKKTFKSSDREDTFKGIWITLVCNKY